MKWYKACGEGKQTSRCVSPRETIFPPKRNFKTNLRDLTSRRLTMFLKSESVLQTNRIRFIIYKLEFAVESMLQKKAPGNDVICIEMVHKVPQFHTQLLLSLYNHCLRASCLPRTLIREIAAYFSKQEKDSSEPGS